MNNDYNRKVGFMRRSVSRLDVRGIHDDTKKESRRRTHKYANGPGVNVGKRVCVKERARVSQ